MRVSSSKPIAPVAQLDRANGYEPLGREFESLRAHHSCLQLRSFGRGHPLAFARAYSVKGKFLRGTPSAYGFDNHCVGNHCVGSHCVTVKLAALVALPPRVVIAI